MTAELSNRSVVWPLRLLQNGALFIVDRPVVRNTAIAAIAFAILAQLAKTFGIYKTPYVFVTTLTKAEIARVKFVEIRSGRPCDLYEVNAFLSGYENKINTTNEKGEAFLHLAFEVLVKNDNQPEYSFGERFLNFAMRWAEIVLERDDIDVNLQNAKGETPLHCAFKHALFWQAKRLDVFPVIGTILKRDDIDLNIVDKKGNTILICAIASVNRILFEKIGYAVARTDKAYFVEHYGWPGSKGYDPVHGWTPEKEAQSVIEQNKKLEETLKGYITTIASHKNISADTLSKTLNSMNRKSDFFAVVLGALKSHKEFNFQKHQYTPWNQMKTAAIAMAALLGVAAVCYFRPDLPGNYKVWRSSLSR
jgi:hypothetical protein